jgi:hypothetical protein
MNMHSIQARERERRKIKRAEGSSIVAMSDEREVEELEPDKIAKRARASSFRYILHLL